MKEDGEFQLHYTQVVDTTLGQRFLIMATLVGLVLLLLMKINTRAQEEQEVEYSQDLGTLFHMALTVAVEMKLDRMVEQEETQVNQEVAVAGVQQGAKGAEVLIHLPSVKAATQEQL